jgi:uncharacterized protein
MAEVDQAAVIDFLSDGRNYGKPDEGPKRIDTHISIVFIVGSRVYKLKRAVRFSYLDYSTVALRARFCHAEFELNRRTAPGLYRGVRSITRTPEGKLEWDGLGELVDCVVEMERFVECELFDHLASDGRLTRAQMVRLADAIAGFHAAATITPGFGGAQAIADVIADNYVNIAASGRRLKQQSIDDLRSASRAELMRVHDLLETRRANGRVRRCHGDLHLRNICLFRGEPTLFDCIEFDDAFSCIDVLYDLAFLLMDLEHRKLRALGNVLFNRYLDRTDDIAGIAALPLLLSVRACVRAKVAAASVTMQPEALTDARAYLELVATLIKPARPSLIAIGGFSGTGKSTVAGGLAPDFAPAPGARIVRSDVLRKSLMGVAPETRLPATAYAREVSERVYRSLYEQAALVLAAGYTAIVDATFTYPAARDAIAAVATHAGVPFVGLWLTAPEAVLGDRVAARRDDASDADLAVLRNQLKGGTGQILWTKVDTTGDAAASIAAARLAMHPGRI